MPLRRICHSTRDQAGRGVFIWLTPGDPPDSFPDPAQALAEPNGLLAAGGDLSPARLLAAYRRGIFPWFSPGQQILWWSPDPREVLWPARFHVARSLRRELAHADHDIRTDTSFAAVIASCAAPRARSPGSWITGEMRAAYLRLHELGHAHSIEVWRAGQLVGGLYGVRIGSVFCGESMFSATPSASKLALAHLAGNSAALGVDLIDCQMESRHLRSLGSQPMPRAEFLARLAAGAAAGLH
jgi:leucyl/phenylalanyl-tRNA--protein transferase